MSISLNEFKGLPFIPFYDAFSRICPMECFFSASGVDFRPRDMHILYPCKLVISNCIEFLLALLLVKQKCVYLLKDTCQIPWIKLIKIIISFPQRLKLPFERNDPTKQTDIYISETHSTTQAGGETLERWKLLNITFSSRFNILATLLCRFEAKYQLFVKRRDMTQLQDSIQAVIHDYQ